MEGVVRYDGSRFITEEEIHSEFTGRWVLIYTEGRPNAHEGYLVASADGRDIFRPMLSDISIDEFDCKTRIIYGCAPQDEYLNVRLLG